MTSEVFFVHLLRGGIGLLFFGALALGSRSAPVSSLPSSILESDPSFPRGSEAVYGTSGASQRRGGVGDVKAEGTRRDDTASPRQAPPPGSPPMKTDVNRASRGATSTFLPPSVGWSGLRYPGPTTHLGAS